MSAKYQNKYRIASARLQTWNYGWNAAYFVTICTKDRKFHFGEVMNKEMKLSNIGVIANVLWFEIKNHAKNISLDEFMVVPNHVHGILILNSNDRDIDIGNDDDTNTNVDHAANAQTRHALSPPFQSQQPIISIGQQRFQNQGKNTISSIVGSYKSVVTNHCNRLRFDFVWESRFHDHMIHEKKSFDRISNYIRNNPLNWSTDQFLK